MYAFYKSSSNIPVIKGKEFDFDDDNSSLGHIGDDSGLQEDEYDSDDDKINSQIKRRLNI